MKNTYSSWAGIFLVAAALGACGGGGSSTTSTASSTTPSTPSGTTSTTPSTTTSTSTTSGTPTSTTTPVASTGTGTSTASTPVTTPSPAVPAVIPSLSGVAAAGSPMLGAMVRIVDANGARVNMIDGAGNLVDRYRTSTADGSFRFQLSTPTPSLPLLVQVAGVDGTGTPVVIHSTLNTTTLPQIVNVTPATEAIVAQVLGASPKSVFANAATVWPTMTLMGSATAVTSASNLVKTLIAANLTDAKITDTKNLDFFRDETFVANKLGLDAALESLRIQIVKDSIGRDQLQLTNKFLVPGTVEVKVDLATAQTELAKGLAGQVNKSISSTAKITSSPLKTGLPNLGTLDDLSTAVNKMIAQGSNASAFLASPILSAHKYQDGRSRTALADILAGYATRNQQLGRFLVTGCVDNPVPTTGCTKVSVSALVTDRSGNVVDVLTDTATYNALSSPVWVFVGNDRLASSKVYSVAQASFNLDGVAQVGVLAPSNGIQVVTRAVDYSASPAQAIKDAVLQVPSGYSVLYKYCGAAELCITPNATLNPVATGELKDTQLQRPAPGWLGSQDAARGAKYVASVSLTGTTQTDTVTPYLMSDLATDLSIGLFPKPDASLSVATMVAGGAVNWAKWANANPDMRMVSLRMITTGASGAAQITDYPLANPYATTLTLPATSTASGGFQLWMVALDALGRRYYSQFNSAF